MFCLSTQVLLFIFIVFIVFSYALLCDRSFSFDPFLDLSVSIDSNTNNQSSSSFGSTGRGILQSIRQAATGSGGGSTTNHNNSDTHNSKCTLEKCLEKFTGKSTFSYLHQLLLIMQSLLLDVVVTLLFR